MDIDFFFGGAPCQGSVQVNRGEDGRVSEVFCRPFKSGAEMEGLLDRFCIMLSVALRHGARLEDIAKTMGDDREPPECLQHGGERVSENVFSAVIWAALALEQEATTPPSEPAAEVARA